MSKKRPDGDGTVRKRKDGRWEGRIVIGHKDDGAPIFKSVFAKTQKELMPKLHTAINEYRGVELSENSSMTLNEWIDRWLEEYALPTLRPSTINSYEQDIKNHIRPALGDIQRQVYHVAGGLHISKPKTKSSDRTIILPPSVVNILREHKEHTNSQWIFPSPVKEGEPIDPQSVYRKMRKVLERAQCKRIRFHDLRHTFATTALEHGMDIKTLSTIIGHISSATTIDIYSHITDTMQLQAANKIERGIGNSEAFEASETAYGNIPDKSTKPPKIAKFEPYRGKICKPGTGGIYEINEHLFEGRYTPTNAHGKREVHTVYAKIREECEKMLEQMIAEVREKIKAEKEQLKAE